jgi:hypothetical protein
MFVNITVFLIGDTCFRRELHSLKIKLHFRSNLDNSVINLNYDIALELSEYLLIRLRSISSIAISNFIFNLTFLS